jgi:hypothetical protein
MKRKFVPILNPISTTPQKVQGQWIHRSRGQIHAPGPLLPGKVPVPIGLEVGWTPERGLDDTEK